MINAFHSNWTTPFFKLNPDKEYYIEDFEILTTIISALMWRAKNGSIKMITDEIGASYYRKLGIDKIWDLGIDTSLEKIDNSIDSNLFWAAGKIHALKNYEAPCVMLDTDFIVWDTIEDLLLKSDISVIHKEEINPWVYPNKEYFSMKNGYLFDEKWNWTVLPSNTAFAYIADNKFKEYYTTESIKFMKNLINSDDRIVNMVFAEQRLISMCAERKNIKINELMTLESLFSENQKLFTHTWGYKQEMKNDFNKRKEFCIRCINRIISDYPQYKDMLMNIKALEIYCNEINK